MSYSSCAGSRSHLFRHTQHPAALQRGDGGNAVDEVGIRHWDGAVRPMITSWSMLAAAGRANRFCRGSMASTKPSPPPRSRTCTQSPTSGADALLAELSPGPALQQLPPVCHVVEAAEGLFNAALGSKADHLRGHLRSPLIYSVHRDAGSPVIRSKVMADGTDGGRRPRYHRGGVHDRGHPDGSPRQDAAASGFRYSPGMIELSPICSVV